MSEDEMMSWVRESYQVYAYRHILGLLTQTLASVINSKKLKDATAVIDSLYDVETERDDNNGNRFGGLFNQRRGSMAGMTMGLGASSASSAAAAATATATATSAALSGAGSLFTQRLRR